MKNVHYAVHRTMILCAFWASVSFVRAQSDRGPEVLMSELCGCMAAIELDRTDRQVEAAVRTCLETAVLEHPAEVRAILHGRPSEGSKAYQLGTALGGALQRMCQPFSAVRNRLRAIPVPVKQGT